MPPAKKAAAKKPAKSAAKAPAKSPAPSAKSTTGTAKAPTKVAAKTPAPKAAPKKTLGGTSSTAKAPAANAKAPAANAKAPAANAKAPAAKADAKAKTPETGKQQPATQSHTLPKSAKGHEASNVDESTKTAGKKPAFDDKFIEAQRLLLLEERTTYSRQAASLQAEADSLAEQREPGDVQFDEESGEGDTLAVERERDLALSARARQEVEEINRALQKIEDGTYGICEISGQPIPKARLQAIPQARERVEYKVGGFGRR